MIKTRAQIRGGRALRRWRQSSMNVRGYVYWSIYVRTSSIRKLKQTHLPPIAAALETLDFDWQIFTEEDNPGLFRLIIYQNLEGATVDYVIVPTLRRAYRLANNWSIGGLDDLTKGKLRYVFGVWSSSKPSHTAPALESMMFELVPGTIPGMNADGGWGSYVRSDEE